MKANQSALNQCINMDEASVCDGLWKLIGNKELAELPQFEQKSETCWLFKDSGFEVSLADEAGNSCDAQRQEIELISEAHPAFSIPDREA